MRAVSLMFSVLVLAFGAGTINVPEAALAKPTPVARDNAVSDDATTGQHLDMNNRAALRCAEGKMLLRTAYTPNQAPNLKRFCVGEAERIGAGYARLLSNTAVRQPHHRLRG